MTNDNLYRVRFLSEDKIYEVYAREVLQGELYGFVILSELVFDNNTTVVVDPSEEKLKSEFSGVRQTIIPMHSIIRIDEVEKRGTAKITEVSGNISQFPSPVYTPRRSDS